MLSLIESKGFYKNQILSKILVTMLIITLTFANIILLGSYLLKDFNLYAAGIDDNTNNENVKFKVYFKDDATEKSSYNARVNNLVNSMADLYIKISVENEGYLENASIEFLNKNFEFVDKNQNNFEVKKLVKAGESLEFKIPIKVFDKSFFDKDLLNYENFVKLTGNYKKDANNIEIESVKAFNLKWIRPEYAGSILKQNIITNNIFNIEEVNKRVVQVEINSSVHSNVYPVSKTKLEINVPRLSGVLPEEVNVLAYNTLATNGKKSIDFNHNNWEYSAETGILNIIVENTPDSSNKIRWNKNSEDQFVVVYTYADNVDVSGFSHKINSLIQLFDEESPASVLEAEDILDYVHEEDFGEGNILKFDILNTVYKGSLYQEGKANYSTNIELNITKENYSELIAVKNSTEYFNQVDQVESYFNKITFNKKELIKVLGQDWKEKAYIRINGDETSDVMFTDLLRRRRNR